jgi:hypothetical protein
MVAISTDIHNRDCTASATINMADQFQIAHVHEKADFLNFRKRSEEINLLAYFCVLKS